MPKLPEINRIRLKDIKLLKPELHDQLMEFCSELDPEKFPEATLITEGKYKTLAVLGTIHAKLARKSKKEKNAKKQLQEAENLILDAHALVGGGSNLSHRQKPERKTFGRAIMQGMSEGIQKAAQTIQMAKEMRELLESIKMYEKAGKLHSKKKEYADAGFFFQQAAELMAEVYKKTKNWKDLEKSQRLFQRARVNYEQAPELEQSADLLVRFAVCIVHTGYYHPDNEKKPAGLYHKAALLENDPKKKLDYALNAGRQYLKKGWGHTKKMLEVYQIAVRCEDKIEKKAEYLLECMTKIEASYRGFIIADLKKLKGTRENDEVIASLISAHVIELLSADPTLKYFKYEDVNRVSSLFDVIAELDTDKKIKDSFWISLVALHAAGGGVHSLNQFIDTVAELTKEDRKELVHTTIVKLIVEAKTQRDTGNFDVSSNLLSVAATLETDKKKKIELYLAAARDAFEEWKKEKDEQQVFKAINKSLNFYKKAIELISEPKEKTELARKTARMFAKEAEICQLNGQYGLAAILYYGAASMVEDKEMKKNYCLIEIQNWQALTDITKREKDRNPDDHYRNNNWRDSVKLFRSSMGSAYLIAAEAEENSNKKSRFFVLAAEYSKSKGSGDLAEIYKKAIDVLETESARNKLRDEVVQKLLKNASSPSARAVTYVEIVKLYETKDEKIAALEKSAEHFIEANSLGSAIESYESILKLVEPEKSLPYHLKLGELCVKHGNLPLAHVSYKKASELSETKEQKFFCSLRAAEAALAGYGIWDNSQLNLSTIQDAYNFALENCEETKKAEVKKEASRKIAERADQLLTDNKLWNAP
ncbi:MAG: hypothetical protein Q7S22_00250, partial [Candidatus Micrarchaeota archaeon]|nr:hypothetical protein [Candidatus Micrarchaeota archaeon]